MNPENLTKPNWQPSATKQSPGRSNRQWIEGVASQDSVALEDLRGYLCRGLHGALAGRANASDIEDYAQQALIRIAERLDRFRGDSRFTTWACAIAIRIALTDLRRKRWRDVSLDAMLETNAPSSIAPSTTPSGDTLSAHGELIQALNQGIDEALSTRQREVILAELQGVPSVVLGERLDMSRGALYKMYYDARKKLRQYLEERGFDLNDVRFALNRTSNQ